MITKKALVKLTPLIIYMKIDKRTAKLTIHAATLTFTSILTVIGLIIIESPKKVVRTTIKNCETILFPP